MHLKSISSLAHKHSPSHEGLTANPAQICEAKPAFAAPIRGYDLPQSQLERVASNLPGLARRRRESEKIEMAKPSLLAGFTDPFGLAVD